MADLSICFPFSPPAQGGGGYGFLRMWEAWLTKEGIPWSRKITDRHPVLFVNSWQTHPLKVAAACAIRRGVTVVHRVDGWPPLYGRTDGIERRLKHVNRFADLTIYQSQWAKTTLSAHLDPWEPRHAVIYNPVDVDTFKPRERPADNGPNAYVDASVVAVSWSTNPLKGGATIFRLARDHPRVEVCYVGRCENKPEYPNLRCVGVLNQRALIMELQYTHALVTFSQHEACPNHVLEAMACGLPVLYLDSGATGEIVGEAGFPTTEEEFGEDLRAVLGDHGGFLRKEARERALHFFAPDVVFPQYLDAIRRAMR